MIEALRQNPHAGAAALALIDFLWQGAVLGIIAALALTMLRRRSPNIRYAVACAALGLMCTVPVATFLARLDSSHAAPSQTSDRAAATRTETLPSLESARAGTTDSWPGVQRWLDDRSAELLLVWLAGVLLLSARLCRDWLAIGWIRRTALPLDAGRLASATRDAARRLGIRRAVTLVSSTRVAVPAVIGWLKPVILVPAGLVGGFPSDQLEAIIVHELAHIRRADFIVNAFQCAVEVLLFYHPAVWWISHRIRIEREQCADDLAIATSSDRLVYVNALASLESTRAGATALAVGAERDLLARIKRLVEPELAQAPRLPGGLVMTSTVLLLAFALSGTPAATPIETQTRIVATAAHEFVGTPRVASVGIAGSPKRAKAPVQKQAITGTVRDAKGGVIPGAAVDLERTGAIPAGSATTNARGVFTIANLDPGQYALTVSARGFLASRLRLAIREGVNDPLIVQLEIGRLTEEVIVSSGAATRTSTQSSPAEYFDLAKLYYTQGRLLDAEQATKQAIALMQSEAPTAATGPLPDTSRPIRVGGDIKEPKKIRDVKPIYPAEAAAAGIQGLVWIEARIGQNGAVQEARVISMSTTSQAPEASGLGQAALGAVRQWLYTPTLLNGVPVDVLMTVTVRFR